MLFNQDFFNSLPVGLLWFNGNGIIEMVNSAFYQYGVLNVQYSVSLINKNIFSTNIFNDFELKEEILSLKNGSLFEKEISSTKRIDGSQITVLLKGAPNFADGNFEGGTLIIEDIKVTFELQKESVIASDYFREILLELSDYYFITDKLGNVKYTPSYKDQNKFSFLFNKINHNIAELFGRSNPESLKRLFAELEKSKESKSTKLSAKTSEKLLHFSAKFIPIFSRKKELQFFIVFLTDDSDIVKLTEEQSREIEDLKTFYSLTASIIDPVFSISNEGNIQYWNEQAAKLFGYSKSEVFSKNINKILTVFSSNYIANIKEEIQNNIEWHSHVKIDNNPKIEVLDVRAKIVTKDNKEEIVFKCADITESYYDKNKLKNSEEQFRTIVENSLEYMCSIDLEGNFLFVNKFFVKDFGYSEEEFLGLKIYNLIDPDFVETKGFSIDDCLGNNKKLKELTLVKQNGDKVEVVANFTSVLDEDRQLKYINIVFLDITSKKNTEKDFLMIKSVFEVSHDGIVLLQNKKIILANLKLVELFNFESKDKLIGMDFLDLISNEDSMIANQFMDRMLLGETKPEPFEFTGITADGLEIQLENTFTYYQAGGETYLVSVIRDISAEKAAQKVLEESEERYRNITSNIDEFLWTAERIEGKLQAVFYTEAVFKITEYTAKDFINNKNLWHRIIHPNDLAEVIKRLKMLYRDPVADSGEIEYRIITANGKIIWIKNRINVKRDSSGDVTKIFGSVRDITNNKRAEERLKESTQNLKELNDTKDRFISIISHDLRTPFSSILGFTDLLISEPNMEIEKRMQYTGFIQESSKNMLSLVNALLDWTRLQTGRINFEPERLNVRYVISNTIQMLAGVALKKNITLNSEVYDDIFIHADENLIMQVFNNLISNAIKFTGENGTIEVFAEPDIDNNQVQFVVKDNGLGIKEEDIGKLFIVDTKFTTNGTAGEKGSGLGLSLCQEIVSKHGGKIWVESRVGAGSEFIFTIPASSTQILLVDDITADRILYTKLLKSILPNYSIIEAENGKEALELVKQYSPALVVTDHVMPIMTGTEFVQQLNFDESGHRPPVIVLSGDINSSIAESYSELGVEFVFNKPVNLTNFKYAVQKSLKQAIYR